MATHLKKAELEALSIELKERNKKLNTKLSKTTTEVEKLKVLSKKQSNYIYTLLKGQKRYMDTIDKLAKTNEEIIEETKEISESNKILEQEQIRSVAKLVTAWKVITILTEEKP